MEESRNNRRTWEEEIYWQNFNFAQFSLILSNDFHHQITLPKKFSDNMKTMLPEQVVLKVNIVSWNVNIAKGKDGVVLHGDEWEEFVTAYSLKKKDVLLFKYNRRECFEVFVFDGTSLCEKEASYFFRRDHHEKDSDDDDEEEEEDNNFSSKAKENLSKGRGTNTSRNRSRSTPAKTACARECSDESDDVEELDESSDEGNSISEEVIITSRKAAIAKERGLGKRKRTVDEFILVKKSTRKKSIGIHDLRYESNRRPVTGLEIESALKKARDAAKLCTNQPFIVVMRPSCVYSRFFMTIPAEWKPMTVFKRKQQVILKVEDKTWLCKVTFNKSAVGFQSRAWRDFVRDNFLEEDDACLFIHSGFKDGTYVLDANIFRVVSEVAPPTLCSLAP